MKIVHVMDWYMPNMGYQENFLPLEQKKLGNDVEIICSDRIPKIEGFKETIGIKLQNRIIGEGNFPDNGINIHRLNCYEIRGLVFLKGLKKKIDELKPDIVHLHGSLTLSTFRVLISLNNKNYKIVVDDHSNINNMNLSLVYKVSFKLFYKIYSRKVACFLPVTYSAENNLKNILGINDDKINIIHLGGSSNRFYRNELMRREARRELNLDHDDILLIFAGKFTKKKDVHVLIESLNLSILENLKLLLIGQGSEYYMNYLYSLVKKFNLQNNIIFKDFVPNYNLPKYYNAADIGVWPGNHSITVIEASLTGLPIIIPDNILAYKIFTENCAGIGFQRGNVNQLAELITQLASDKPLRDKLMLNAIKLGETTLSWKKIAEKTIDIYLNY
nr:glycosyltransferase family 4 protein [uncultured Methanobacterium sp.]